MEAKGYSPSVVTYTSLIHGLCQLNYLDEAKALLQEMEAKSIIANMVSDGCTPGEDTWNELVCRVWGKQKAQDAVGLMSEVLSGN
ncbi:pentatricopeptide repeat-containing protein [Tanacetum coccineum]